MGILSWRLAALLAISSASVAPRISAQDVQSNLRDLESTNSATRMAGLDALERLSRRDQFALCSPDASAPIRKGLIAGLEKENDVVRTMPSLPKEEARGYYSNLGGCVAKLRDTSAVRALVGAIEVQGDVLDGLVALGDAAVPALLRAAAAKSRRGPSVALMTLGMLAKTPISPANSAAIRTRELAALGDDDPSARMEAINALSAFPDSVVRGAVRAVALAPAQGIPGSETNSQIIENMVRDVAITWVKQDSANIAGASTYKRLPSQFRLDGCTAECCGYGPWTATATRVAFAKADSTSRPVFTVHPNDHVVSDSGIEAMLTPGLLRATRTSRVRALPYPYRLGWTFITVPAGDTLHVLSESAEATDDVIWYRGSLYWTGGDFPDFVALSTVRSTWWAAVKNELGQVGWIAEPMSAFTGPGECH